MSIDPKPENIPELALTDKETAKMIVDYVLNAGRTLFSNRKTWNVFVAAVNKTTKLTSNNSPIKKDNFALGAWQTANAEAASKVDELFLIREP